MLYTAHYSLFLTQNGAWKRLVYPFNLTLCKHFVRPLRGLLKLFVFKLFLICFELSGFIICVLVLIVFCFKHTLRVIGICIYIYCIIHWCCIFIIFVRILCINTRVMYIKCVFFFKYILVDELFYLYRQRNISMLLIYFCGTTISPECTASLWFLYWCVHDIYVYMFCFLCVSGTHFVFYLITNHFGNPRIHFVTHKLMHKHSTSSLYDYIYIYMFQPRNRFHPRHLSKYRRKINLKFVSKKIHRNTNILVGYTF